MATFNTNRVLWVNYKVARATMPWGGAPLTIHNGMVGNGIEVLARFESDQQAARTLKAAGFKRDNNRTWK